MPPTSVAEMLYSTADSMDSAVSRTTFTTAMMVAKDATWPSDATFFSSKPPPSEPARVSQEAVHLVEDSCQVQDRPQHNGGHHRDDAECHGQQERHLQDGPGVHLADQQARAADLGLRRRLDQPRAPGGPGGAARGPGRWPGAVPGAGPGTLRDAGRCPGAPATAVAGLCWGRTGAFTRGAAAG